MKGWQATMTPYNYATVEIGLQARGRSADDFGHHSGKNAVVGLVLIVLFFAVLFFLARRKDKPDPEEEAREKARKALCDRLDAEYAAREAKKEQGKK